MSTDAPSVSGDTHDLVDVFLDFYERYYREEILVLANHFPSEQKSLELDWYDLYRYDHELADDYLARPDDVRDYAEDALRLYDLPIDRDLDRAHVRVTNLPESATRSVGDYYEDDVGKLLSVHGQVAKTTPSVPVLDVGAFECQRCGTITEVPQHAVHDRHDPHECVGCERQGPFQILFDQSEFDDYQLARLQVPPGRVETQSEEKLDVQLFDDVVDTVSPGDRVQATVELHARSKDDDSCEFEYYARAESIDVRQTDWEDTEVEPHKDRFVDLAESDDPYQVLVNSINPTHRGDDDIKLALALQLFGGVKKRHGDDSETRGTIHVFLIGDPGTGKSSHLQAAAALAPRSIYTNGKGNSAAGVAASAVRDDFGDTEWTLQGGTMVKANRGVAAIDELDKMSDADRESMFEALSEQQVSVSKAGITATLPAETSLLAGANPEYGRFDQYEPIAEQIDLDPALVSRFDLMFTVTDQPDEDADPEIIDHKNRAWKTGLQRASSDVDASAVADDATVPEVSPEVLRAWIAYAKQHVVPVPTDAAMARLREEFTELRFANDGVDDDAPVPVTYRKQEAIQRLAEASARVRLSDTLTVADVERALGLVRDCLKDVGVDPETGQFDADVIETGTSKTQNDRRKWVRETIQEFEDESKWGAPIEAVVAEADDETGLNPTKLKNDVEALLEQGKAYEPQDGYVRIS